MSTPVVSVRADKQNLAMTGGTLRGLIVETFSFASLSEEFTGGIDTFDAFHLYSLSTDGVLNAKTPMEGVDSIPLLGASGDAVDYPVIIPLTFAALGGNVYVFELIFDGIDGPAHPQLRRYSGSSFVSSTVIPIDGADWGPSTGLASAVFFLGLFGLIAGTIFPVVTDGANILVPGNLSEPFTPTTLTVESFSTAGGAPNASYAIEGGPDSQISQWVVDSDNASFWMFNASDADISYGPFAGPYTIPFPLLANDIYETGSFPHATSAAVDFTDSFLYVLWSQTGGPNDPVITKIDPNSGEIVDRYTLTGSREGFEGPPSINPYKIAADNGVLYVVAVSDLWILSFNSVWKIDTATGAGADNPAFNACGIALSALVDAGIAPDTSLSTEEVQAILATFIGLFDLVMDIEVAGDGHNGTPIVLRSKGDVRITSNLRMETIPANAQSQGLLV